MFKSRDIEGNVQTISNLLPNGDVFYSKNIDDSNFRKLLRIFGSQLNRFEELISEISENFNISDSVSLVERWESALGIPDHCFVVESTIEKRRINIIIKLACMNISTEADIHLIAQKLGKTIALDCLENHLYPPYSIPYIPYDTENSRFIWIVSGTNIVGSVPPYSIPFTPSTNELILQCILEHIKPAIVRLVYQNT